MAEFKTPKKNRMEMNTNYHTPLKIPATPQLKQIGYGSHVQVFTFERSPKVGFTRSPWAIKKRNTKLSDDKRYDKRIQLEASILKHLNHPNIVGFRGLGLSQGGLPCLAMEKLEKSLGDMIEERLDDDENIFSAKEIEYVGFEIAKGLEYLHHSVMILHGDMKSYNILISNDMKIVKICDFGVSLPLNKDLEVDSTNADFGYTGTECWNAPEVFLDGPITNKTDMWAYGLILWEMIALSPPHADVEMESIDQLNFEESMNESLNTTAENNNPNSSFWEDSNDFENTSKKKKDNNSFGTRPALPAIDIGPEYNHVLEIFFLCTDQDYKTRPSAKGLVNYFKAHTKP